MSQCQAHLKGYYLRLSFLAGYLDDAGEMVRGGGDDGAGPRPREEEAEVGPGDQEVTGGQQASLVHSLTGRQVDGLALLLQILQLSHVVLVLVVQAEHVASVLVQLSTALVEVNMFGLGRRVIARVVDVVEQTVL